MQPTILSFGDLTLDPINQRYHAQPLIHSNLDCDKLCIGKFIRYHLLFGGGGWCQGYL
jgi:hypothetical protein